MMRPGLTPLIAPLAALLLSVAIGSALVLAYGASPFRVWALLLDTTWGNAYGFGQVLYKATSLMLTGLAVALALRAGLFNIGCEGQIVIGSFLCALLGRSLGGVPAVAAIPLCLLAAFAGGAATGALPGWLKARTGSHEVIHTIMLNFITQAAVVFLGGRFFVRETLHTHPIADSAHLARLSEIVSELHGSGANLALVLALLAAGGVAIFLWRTRLGLELRALGSAPRAAAVVGVSVGGTTILAMTLSGGLAGLVGANFVMGYKGYFEQGFSGGVGFVGIAVALLGRSHPVGVIVAALLVATFSQGALGIHAVVPKPIVDVMLAVILISATAMDAWVRRILVRRAT